MKRTNQRSVTTLIDIEIERTSEYIQGEKKLLLQIKERERTAK
jgi:hypothetical protein